jgi:hypothetical protein
MNPREARVTHRQVGRGRAPHRETPRHELEGAAGVRPADDGEDDHAAWDMTNGPGRAGALAGPLGAGAGCGWDGERKRDPVEEGRVAEQRPVVDGKPPGRKTSFRTRLQQVA